MDGLLGRAAYVLRSIWYSRKRDEEMRQEKNTHTPIDLKKLDINGEVFFFCPTTYTTFTVDRKTAVEIEKAIERQDVDALIDMPEVINAICSHEIVPAQNQYEETAVSLVLTENCNLRCHYCWQHQDRARHMNAEIAQQGVDFLFRISEKYATQQMSLGFFGGEPLLRTKLIRQVISYAEAQAQGIGRHLRFTLTTNGLLLNPELIRYLAQHRCQVSISLDGPSQIHDAQRRFPDGRPSQSQAVEALRLLLDQMPPQMITVLMTVHHQSLPWLEESVEYVLSLGIQNVRINSILSDGLPEDSPLTFTGEDYRQFAQYLQNKYLKYAALSCSPYATTVTHRYLDRADLHMRRHTRCNAGRSIFGIGTDGGIYPCIGFAFTEMQPLGHVSVGLNTERWQAFLEACGTVDNSPVCHDCWLRYLCGGGCYLQAFLHHQNLRCPWAPDCLGSKTMIESALSAKMALAAQRTQNQQRS